MIQRVFPSIGARLGFFVTVMLIGYIVVIVSGVAVYNLIDEANKTLRILSIPEEEIRAFKKNDLNELVCDEAKLLAAYYYCQFDYANYQYYSYLSRFGVRSAGKHSNRTENTDLSIPLAIQMDIREIRSMDDQTYMKEYHDYWKACSVTTDSDGEIKYFKKELRKASFYDVQGFLFGVGKMVNKEKVAALYHGLNSFEFRKTNCESCDKGNYYWDYRNKKMANNIAKQVLAGNELRSVVVVGAGHIYGLIDAFERDFPEIKVKLYRDL